MSKAGNHVTWCLNNAQKDIKEGRLHRGLVKVKTDSKLAMDFIRKAEHNLEALRYNKQGGYYDWCINMGFYVMYHCCLAIITKFGFESRNQECSLSLVESLVEDGKLDKDFLHYIGLIKSSGNGEGEQISKMREKYQYTTETKIDIQKVNSLIDICEDMIKVTKGAVK
jgi:uncharacterized protein (UPF0332 family)